MMFKIEIRNGEEEKIKCSCGKSAFAFQSFFFRRCRAAAARIPTQYHCRRRRRRISHSPPAAKAVKSI